jgi:glycosyltransferase involved in cell wall biosynthesis
VVTNANYELPIGGGGVFGTAGDTLHPPLVSFVLINWNYAAYVGAAIDSIRAQDYPHFECLVVDNGSTDHSRDVIKKHIEGDARFRLLAYPENIGQLGAAFAALDEIKGGLVTFVDADDVLFSAYGSSHVLAHLALPRAVSFTSSNVIEMDAAGHALATLNNLTRANNATYTQDASVENVSVLAALFEPSTCKTVAERTWTVPKSEDRWVWGPGTSNMYRASVLRLLKIDGETPHNMRAADGFFNPTCNSLTGSALINLSLSAYRIHGNNYFAKAEKLNGLRSGSEDYHSRKLRLQLVDIEFFLRKFDQFRWIVPDDYFVFLDRIARVSKDKKNRRKFYSQPQIFEIFSRHAKKLRSSMRWRRFVRNIFARFAPMYALRVLFKSL